MHSFFNGCGYSLGDKFWLESDGDLQIKNARPQFECRNIS